jgi:hypothetical protein
MYGTPFSYGMSSFESSSILTYSTLKTITMGERSSNDPLQGSSMGPNSLFNVIPYGGGHIPPPTPSLGGTFQHSIEINTNSSFLSWWSHRPQSYMNIVGYMPFYLFNVFGNNYFSLSSFSARGNPTFGQKNPT